MANSSNNSPAIEIYGNLVCRVVSKLIYARAGKKNYLGNVVYSTEVNVSKGDALVVYSTIQGVNNVNFPVMLGTFLSVTMTKPTDKPARLAELGKKIAPPRATNIRDSREHYDMQTRHGVYSATASGKVFVNLVAYAASTGLVRDSALGVGNKGGDMTIIKFPAGSAIVH